LNAARAGGSVTAVATGAGRRDALVGLLALGTGSLDVIGFTRLGGAFTSVITGNVALLGLAAGRRDTFLAIHTGVAFLGYIVGVGLGARVAANPHPDQPIWPRQVSLVLLVEVLSLILFAAAWELSGQAPSGDTQLGLLSLASAAMGLQSAAVGRLAIPGLSSTYLTGTLTGVVTALVQRRDRAQVGRGVLALVTLAVGAGVGGLLVISLPWAAPLWAILVVGVVLAAAERAHRAAVRSVR
jgi:uncharacterized membrane protein YoaK (UPF0700 family)